MAKWSRDGEMEESCRNGGVVRESCGSRGGGIQGIHANGFQADDAFAVRQIIHYLTWCSHKCGAFVKICEDLQSTRGPGDGGDAG